MNYWLMKSEPSVYSILDLQTQKQTIWDGVRNYQARNFLKQMQIGDLAFFYHSNAEPPGIFGLMKIVETGIADPTQFDTNSKYYDPKSTPESPRWLTVKVEFAEVFSQPIFLSTLKEKFTGDELLVVKKGNRLSVISVGESVAKNILAMNN
ncbi:MAG: EVE domain-containing protein [Sphaerospermopsis sp.]|jgi:predicted RNA-binding protein with PUA-like domain|uniref:EVE domain-containing protein n=3 Tax=Sphaerospermopsis TaxID=752201 RepID=A0A479ZVT6_9CYAN|nr:MULTISPECIES: EVE domain-containing protein [Sphaerospermopsis]MBC5797744.1 EVE domain-containing protein [Sphaerospermopsis sp. LEGE 00249]MBD2143981.1 EVE domain-containing protein [Sphaerospermopsis sp. FACHB-1194]MEB3149860.1 EVE domain-containing protein [Sphaerospermopsis sp.]MBD2134568.1 EVE domain-containing protein [Sphaerospermopsis sp. FACHB-1094]MBE9236810.1 EVE domain-containing protein [Sphaerospermopsis aphanizomenoides LEGE 00250]